MDSRIQLLLLIAIGVIVIIIVAPAPQQSDSAVTLLLDHDPPQVQLQTASGPVIFDVEIADEPVEWQTGLMFRSHLSEHAGMLFIFPDEAPRSFWMKNTLIPLDMIFISANLEIVHIERDVPPCEADPCPSYSSVFPARHVLEINGGLAKEIGI